MLVGRLTIEVFVRLVESWEIFGSDMVAISLGFPSFFHSRRLLSLSHRLDGFGSLEFRCQAMMDRYIPMIPIRFDMTIWDLDLSWHAIDLLHCSSCFSIADVIILALQIHARLTYSGSTVATCDLC